VSWEKCHARMREFSSAHRFGLDTGAGRLAGSVPNSGAGRRALSRAYGLVGRRHRDPFRSRHVAEPYTRQYGVALVSNL